MATALTRSTKASMSVRASKLGSDGVRCGGISFKVAEEGDAGPERERRMRGKCEFGTSNLATAAGGTLLCC